MNENWTSDRRIRLTQQKAEMADGKKGGRIATLVFPDGSTPREQNGGSRLPDVTVERLQGCVQEFGEQLEAESNQVLATVKVDPEGRTQGVSVVGVPESDFTACVQVALQDMAVPRSALSLRRG